MKSIYYTSLFLGTAFGAAFGRGGGGSGGKQPSQPSKPFCSLYDDNYDDLPTNPVAPQLATVGTYHGLVYSGWVVAVQSTPLPFTNRLAKHHAQQPSSTSGVIPHTKANVAAAAMAQNLVEMGTITLNPFGSMSAAPGVKYFDLYSFYFGCLLDLQNAVASAATGCTISVTGYNYKDQQVPVATFSFAPTQLEGNKLNYAVLPAGYTGLKNVTFGIADASVLAAETILDIDDLVHCNY